MRTGARRNARTGFAAVAAIAIALASAAGCRSGPPEDKDYAAKIAADRAAKDAAFLKLADPIPENRKAQLLPLAYFPIDPLYDVPAGLKPIQDDTILQIPTSTGTQRPMRRAGTLEFSLKGQPLKLVALVDLTDQTLDRLTVMFTDLTSGTETYPAGRYLDMTRNASGIYDLDFNRAYHPYCYYNASYECPYPPPENRLPVPIRAGEKLKESKN